MNMIKTAIAAAALAFALSTGAAVAQTTAGTAAPAATAKKVKAPKAASKPKSEASIACSKDADAKNLHGKERKKFRDACKNAAPKVAAPTAPAAAPAPKKS